MLSGQVAVVFRCAVASQVYVYKSAVFLGFRVVNRMRGDGFVYAGPGGLPVRLGRESVCDAAVGASHAVARDYAIGVEVDIVMLSMRGLSVSRVLD